MVDWLVFSANYGSIFSHIVALSVLVNDYFKHILSLIWRYCTALIAIHGVMI